MKKTNHNSPTKRIAASATMLAVSAAMLGTSTYAWFTMNKEVQVTGMEVKTKVGSNLLICTTNLDSDYTSQTLSQTRKALLEPVSSISGATGSFYYTVDAKANGDAVSDAYVLYNENASTAVQNATAGKPNYDPAFNAAYKLGATTAGSKGTFTSDNINMTDAHDGAAYGYIDYTFYLKATTNGSASTTAQKLIMTKCDLDYNDGVLDADGDVGKVDGPDQAWRVAVFAKNVTADKPGDGAYATDICTYTASEGADPTTNQKGLISLVGATNQTPGNAVVSPTSAAGIVYNPAAANGVVLDTINTDNASVYYKVVVRLWLEGEDKTCTSETYAALTNKYNLDLEFELTDGSAGGVTDGTAIKNITSTGSTGNEAWDPTAPSFVGNQYDGQA